MIISRWAAAVTRATHFALLRAAGPLHDPGSP